MQIIESLKLVTEQHQTVQENGANVFAQFATNSNFHVFTQTDFRFGAFFQAAFETSDRSKPWHLIVLSCL